MDSLFTPLQAEGLTSLKIRYDWRTGQVNLWAAQEWTTDFDFSQYNQSFYAEGIYTSGARYLNTHEVYALFAKHQLTSYLETIIDLICQGKHVGIECYFLAAHNIRFMCNQHSFKLGLNNKSHALMAGGIRRHGFEDSELEVIIDGLNLGRAMSFKNVAANLSFGGCKTTVHMDPLDLNNLHIMGFLAFALDRSRCMTGPDMNFPTQMADVMTQHFSVQFTGGPNAPLGETGKPTAYGTYLALKQAVKFWKGTDKLKGLSIAVQGLGAVGWYMATYLVEDGAELYITDIDHERVQRFMAEHPEAVIHAVAPEAILAVKADILCPCAMGGIIHEDNIETLSFKLIFGAANNQLRATNQEEEIRLANLLQARGILYQTEWWHNTAGVLCGAEEYYYGTAATYEGLVKKIEAIVPQKTWDNLNQAKALGITPTESAYRTCERLIYN